ncbi:MAG: PIG-L family deacetylase [Gemmatimonadetes bacterium]|nr:PIG-L family deacetylase [Gemmatimonadota bacterium]MXY84207.1 PIG-L family deacetylase [Gemmatimonadota bacterium]MYB69022.1 PIG-L family deacetylase [Gemmatimonadota bacterium]
MVVTTNNRVLVLAPHTDDGELGCGGTISRMVEEGREVYYAAFSTAAESVPPPFPPDILEKEVREGTKVLGIPAANLLVYKYKVRHLPHMRQEILEELVRMKREIDPATVFLPSAQDLHQDHQTVHIEGLRAFKTVTVLGYELPWNNLSFDYRHFCVLTREHVQTKIAALRCYQSQQHRPYTQEEFIWSWARTRGGQIMVEYAEAFDVLRWVR